MAREYRHALTGRSFVVLEGSRTERLVEADKNWTEVKPESSKGKSEPKSGGSRGAGNSVRRRDPARKVADDRGADEG